MPNNDLGTAHGRIRIDFEDKGSKAALLAVQRMQKQLEQLNTKVANIEKTFNKNTRSVDKNAEAFKKAKKESDGWLFSLIGGERILKAFDKDVVELTQDITKLYTKYSQAREKFKPFENTFKVLDRYQRFKLNAPVDALSRSLSKLHFKKLAEGERNARALGRALDSVGLGMSAAWTMTKQFAYGYGSAMKAMPTWTRQVHQFAMGLAGVGAAGLAAGKALNAGFITKFLNTNVFRSIVLQANSVGNSFERLGSITERIFGKNLFGGMARQLKDSENLLSNWTKKTSHTLSGASRGFNSWFKPVAAAAKQIQTFTLGVGLMAAGIADIGSRFAWLGKIPKPLLVGLASVISVVLPAALQVFDKALIGTSNILAGLLVGVKQLAGGALALPGALAAVGAAALTVKTIFGGLKDQFKDVFSTDATEAAQALDKLPDHLKPMGRALKDATDKFREMQKSIQKIAFFGIEDQIKSLTEKYMPRLKSGMSNVAFAMRGVKDEFVAFLEQGQTQNDVNTIFNKTSQIFLNLKKAVRPVSDGLRDIATVGTQFFAEWSGSLGTLSQRFAEWARANRESGALLEWMNQAKAGARDLIIGTKDLGKGLWQIVTMFQSRTGTNFLDRYAESMKRFNAAMKMSRQGGLLFDFSSAVRQLGDLSNKMDTFQSVAEHFMGMLESLAPAIKNVSDSFSSIFVPSLQQAMDLLGLFSKIMTGLNLDNFTGVVLGVVAGFKLLPTFLKPLWDAGRVILGFVFTLSSTSGVIKAVGDGVTKVAGALEKIPVVGVKAATALKNVHNSLSGIIGGFARFAGPIGLAITAMTALFLLFKAGKENAKEFDNQLKQNSANVEKFGRDLTKAFYADSGKLGPTVMDQVSLSMQTLLRDLEDTAAKAPGMVDHIADYLNKPFGPVVDSNLTGGFTGESAAINRRQKEGDAAKYAAEKYRELTDQQVDLTAVITGSQGAFDARIGNLRTQGIAGNALADVLEKQRSKFNQVNEAMQALGPSNIQLINGLEAMSKAGGDAANKLSSLETILKGLGFLKTDALEAAAQYTTTLGDLSNQISQLKDDGADFSNVWNADNTLDMTKESAAKLIPILAQVSSSYRQMAAADGTNIDEITTRLNDTLTQVAPMLNTTADKLKDFFKFNMGAVPVPIKLALQMDGVQDEFAKKIGDLMLQLYRAQEFKIPLVLGFDAAETANTFDKDLETLLGKDFFDQRGQTVVLKAGVTLDEASVLKLQQYLADHANIQTSTGPVVDPAQLPVGMPPIVPPTPAAPAQREVTATPPWVPGAVPQPFSPPSQPFWPAPPSTPQPVTSAPVWPPISQPNTIAPTDIGGLLGGGVENITGSLDAASNKVDEVGGKLQNFAKNRPKIEVDDEKLNAVSTKIDEISLKFNEKKLKADVEVGGTEKLDEIPAKAKTISEQMTGLFNGIKDKIAEALNAAQAKFDEFANAISSKLQAITSSAQSQGSAFVDAFARGIAENTKAITEAENMAAAVKARFHNSPPKKGPLSDHGDAAVWAGKLFVESYATGLRRNASRVAGAAGQVAGAAGQGVSTGVSTGALNSAGATVGTNGGAARTGGGNGSAGAAAGQFFQQFLELTNFASSITDIFGRVSDAVFKFAKFLSDPMGKGTFFGGSLGFKKLSEAEIQKRRNEKDQQSLRSMYEGATRDTTAFDTKMQLIKDAENAVVDQKGYKSSKTAKTVGALIKEAFPEIATIGGARADSLPFHRNGNALDIMIPNWDTKEGKALGDRINKWALSNAQQLGVDYTIWQDFYQPTNGQPGNFQGNKDSNQGHYNHIHLNFASGASIDLSGVQMTAAEQAKQEKQSAQDAAKTALQALQEQYGPPTLDPRDAIKREQKLRLNPDTGQFEPFTPKDQKDLPNGYLNPETKKPWTKAEVDQYVRDNPQVLAIPDNMTPERVQELINNSDFVQGTQREVLDRAAMQNDQIAKALDIAQNPDNYSNRSQEVIDALTAVDNEIIRLNDTGTVGNKQIASDLESVKSTILDTAGFAQKDNPIDTVAGIVSNAVGVTSDIIGTVVTGIESIGAVDNLAKTFVRGVSNTGQISGVIDNVQKFIELGAKVAGSVASVSGLIGSIAGAAGSGDTSGASSGIAAALGSISTVASLIQAGWETTNAVIDITQEAVRIVGTYVGDFLGYLVGGTGGQLVGNVKFLLDKQTNQLMAYGADNPMDKRIHNVPFQPRDMASRDQLIGNINVYGGPGSDPRDLTRQMMFQVNSAQYAGALAQ